MKWFHLLPLSLSAMALFSMAQDSSATTRRVPSQYLTIQLAIDAAVNGDTVLVSDGTYYENIRFKGKRIVVASTFLTTNDTTHISLTIIDGSRSTNPDSGSVVYFVSGEDTTSVLCGFTVQGGSGTRYKLTVGQVDYWVRVGGGVFCYVSGARILRNAVARNRVVSPYAWGGGIEAQGSATVVPSVILEGNRVTDNYVSNNGSNLDLWASSGGADLTDVTARVVGNMFERDTVIGNGGAQGGGLWFGSNNQSSHPVGGYIGGNIFRSNVVKGYTNGAFGGGVVLANTGEVTIRDNLLQANSVTGTAHEAEGGGIGVDDQAITGYGRKMILNNRFLNNSIDCPAYNDGGGGDSHKDPSNRKRK